MQGNKQRSDRNSPNASKELEALQQLNKELWEMNMGLKEINKALGT